MLLIKNVEVYNPQYQGKKDILVSGDKIHKIAEKIQLDESLCKIIDGTGKRIVPGFIDSHVHICGGGGEGGFATRTPEVMLSQIVNGGITTVVGVLGTDGTTRTMTNLVAKTKGLKAEGISAYCMTGSYEVPVRTLTGSIVDDIILIEEIIGAGEIAISDHRSSHPTLEAFRKLASDSRLGGILSKKAGVINVHMGDDKRAMEPLLEVLENSAIPMKQFLPTHINRNPYLFQEGIEYIKKGGFVDFTTSTIPAFLEDGEVECCLGLKEIYDRLGSCNNVTFSSDGQGSLPSFNEKGELTGLTIGTCKSLYEAVKDCIVKTNIPFEEAIKVITCNPADILKLNKGYIKEGKDADFVLLDFNLDIDTVIARGKVFVENKNLIIKGTFE